MKQVKIYNVAKMVQENPSNRLGLEVFGTRKELAVVEGSNGFVVTCSEGVFFEFATKKGSLSLDMCPATEPDADGATKFYIMPTHRTDLPVGDILECEHREAPLGEFIRRFGARLESNYRELLKALKQAGLDPADYPRGEMGGRRFE